MSQTAKQEWCRQTGRMKNCGTFAEYEGGNSGEAAMCNGGIYDGDTYDPCPSRDGCRQATAQTGRQDLVPIRNAPSDRNWGTQIVGRTPSATPENGWRAASAAAAQSWWASSTTLPAARPAAGAQQPQSARPGQPASPSLSYPSTPYPVYVPTPIQPPQQFPQAMQTQFASPIPFHAGGVSPTFLPDNDESILSRLGKNIGQGMIASTGWHIFDFARTVDMFGRRR